MMRFLRGAALVACALSLALPASAQVIGSGHVMGNGTSAARTPTDTPLMSIMNQSGSGLGAGVATALGLSTNGAGGVLVGTAPVAVGGTGVTSLTANAPLIGNGTSPVAQGTRSGNTTIFGTVSGTPANGNCAQWNSGNLIDAGVTCNGGSGSGTVTAGTAGQLAYYPSSGTTVAGTYAINIPATSQFYASGGAYIQRLNDRVLVGGATGGGYSATSTSNTDWWDAAESSLHGTTTGSDAAYSQFVSEFDSSSPNASLAVPQIAIAAAVQSLGAPSLATPRAIENAAYANSAAPDVAVWGIYGEANYFSGAGSGAVTFGYENEVRAWSAVATTWTPYYSNPAQPALVNQEWGCGSGRSATYSCTAAVYISANPNNYGVGILFLNGSIGQLATGNTTIGAIEMPYNYQIQWYTAGTSVGATIYGDASGNLNIATNGTGGHLFVNGNRVYCGSGATTAC